MSALEKWAQCGQVLPSWVQLGWIKWEGAPEREKQYTIEYHRCKDPPLPGTTLCKEHAPSSMTLHRNYSIIRVEALQVGDEFHWNGDTGKVVGIRHTASGDLRIDYSIIINDAENQLVIERPWYAVLSSAEKVVLLYREVDSPNSKT